MFLITCTTDIEITLHSSDFIICMFAAIQSHKRQQQLKCKQFSYEDTGFCKQQMHTNDIGQGFSASGTSGGIWWYIQDLWTPAACYQVQEQDITNSDRRLQSILFHTPTSPLVHPEPLTDVL